MGERGAASRVMDEINKLKKELDSLQRHHDIHVGMDEKGEASKVKEQIDTLVGGKDAPKGNNREVASASVAGAAVVVRLNSAIGTSSGVVNSAVVGNAFMLINGYERTIGAAISAGAGMVRTLFNNVSDPANINHKTNTTSTTDMPEPQQSSIPEHETQQPISEAPLQISDFVADTQTPDSDLQISSQPVSVNDP